LIIVNWSWNFCHFLLFLFFNFQLLISLSAVVRLNNISCDGISWALFPSGLWEIKIKNERDYFNINKARMRKKEKSSHDIVNRPLPIYIESTYVCISIHKSSVGKFLTNAWLFMLVDVACVCVVILACMHKKLFSFFFLLRAFCSASHSCVSLYWVQWGPFACETIFFHSLKRILWFLFFVSYCFGCFWVFFVGWEIRMRMVKGEALRWLRKWVYEDFVKTFDYFWGFCGL